MSSSQGTSLGPRYALTNCFSGHAGELAVSALLVRAGLRVARPFWSDDYTDLLILQECQGWVIPIPVQVKSVQQAGSSDPVVIIKGLRKFYVERVPTLCLAIYSPPHDKIWFIPGSQKIREVHRRWCEAPRSGSGRRPKPFDEIALDDDIPIRVNVSTAGDTDFDRAWLVDRKSPIEIWTRIRGLAEEFVVAAKRRENLSKLIFELFKSPPPEKSFEKAAPEDAEQPPA